jgi:hypothetical protein
MAGATTVSGAVSQAVTAAGPATGLSSAVSSASGAIQAVGGNVRYVPGLKLPLKNPLFAYATYDYVLSISALTTDTYNDASYVTGRKLPLICKSANADPSNRVNTPYGKFDFFIDNLEMKSLMGNDRGNNTNVAGTFHFTITEPYSMGMFPIALQTAAANVGHPNWRDGPFLLTIQFRGNTELGVMANIPGTTRYIPFQFTNMSSKTNQNGTVYQCEALPYNAPGLSNRYAALRTDVSIRGTTVQEMLSTGEKSLQAAINIPPKQLVKDKTTAVPPEEYVILFPLPGAPTTSPAGTSSDGATIAPTKLTSLYSTLGVSRDSKSGLLIQSTECNELGKTEMHFNVGNKGNIPVSNDSVIYNKTAKSTIRGNMTINYKESDFKFTQDSDVPNAINQVLLQSKFPGQTMDASKLSPEGFRDWWRIECLIYIIDDTSNLTTTGVKPKLIVYRVYPWAVHASRLAAPNVQPPGFDKLDQQIVKSYEYIYTGKNADIINFNIEFNAAYTVQMNSDGFKRSQDVQRTEQESGAPEARTVPAVLAPGSTPSTVPGVHTQQVQYTNTLTNTDRKGGGGNETMATRAARQFNDVINSKVELVNITLDIIGDPYYIVQSGLGTYTAAPTQFKNLKYDGTADHQSGEVDIKLHFRSPIDLNQSTGLYNFNTVSKDAPVLGFTGFYQVISVTSKFRAGVFTQTIEGLRRSGQENPVAATPTQVANTSTPSAGQATLDQDGNVTEESKANPNNYGGG